ncbi:DMT family transporter [Rudanella lutea]|uniref:DMT family transporter n=1 Tax=Rudanella lutea TaxID=451374 RepID=UPI00036144A0|nr:DMT family transporter [Rudanella lutea]
MLAKPVSELTEKRPLIAWVYLCTMALVWGSSFILIKRSLDAFTPQQVAAGRIFLAFLFFVPFQAYQIRQPDVRTSVRRQGPYLLAVGLTGFLLPAYLFAIAGAHINSSLSGALNSLSPLFTLLIGALFFGNRVPMRQTVGILLGLAGSILLVFFSATGEFSVNAYALLVVGATVCYGINTNLIGRYIRHMPALVSTAWIFFFIGLIALGALLFTDVWARAGRPENSLALLALATLGVLGSGLMSILFNRVVQLASPLFAASVTYLIPIVALLWGILDGEQIYAVQYAGMAVCLLGIYLTNKS